MTDIASTTMPDWDDPMAPSGDRRGVRGRPDWSDLLYFVGLSVAAAYCLYAYHDRMDVYEQGILLGIVPLLAWMGWLRSEEHTSELQSRGHLVCRLLLEKKKRYINIIS